MNAPKMAPSLHRNGSSAEVLQSGHECAVRALGAALEALYDSAPNARDFYVQGDRVFNEALREHTSRFERVGTVLREMREIYEAIEEQISAREAQKR